MRPTRSKCKRETPDESSCSDDDDKETINRTSWNDDEVFSLLEIYSSSEITESFQLNKYKVFLVWRTISNKLLNEKNILKTAVQCQDKINALKRIYYRKRKINDQTWIFWESLDNILGKNQLIPVPSLNLKEKSSSDGNGSTGEDCDGNLWTIDENKLFLNILLIPDYQKQFLIDGGDINFWKKVCDSLKLVNVRKSHTQCVDQIRGLQIEYEKNNKLMENGLTPKWCLWQLVDNLYATGINEKPPADDYFMINENWTEEESKTLLNVYCETISNQNIIKAGHISFWKQICSGMADLEIYKNRQQCEERVTFLKKQYLTHKKTESGLNKWSYSEEFRKISEIWQRRVKISKEETKTSSFSPPPVILNNTVAPILSTVHSSALPASDPVSPPVQYSKRIKLTDSDCEISKPKVPENDKQDVLLLNGESNDILDRLKRIEDTNLMFYRRMEERDNQILNVLNNISVACQKIAESLNK